MCGIAGIFNLNGAPVSPVVLRRMTDAIAHRGPDGEGFYTDSFLGLGHRRLAIIDLTPGGHQPMSMPDESIVLSYNGEIYNFREMRAELESRGHCFRSRSDTEVLLHGYAEWGLDVLDRLNGMFAFAIWDRSKQELFLARDRYGIKPLYYTIRENQFVFGSEVKAILAHPAITARLDKRALLEYFTFQNIFTDGTLYDGIRLLPAGHWLRVSLGSSDTVKTQRYWDFDFTEPDEARDEREYEEELDRLFRQAVDRQLVSDVEVGSYLSGGMDSGSISALASAQIPCLKTFTCGFDLHSASGLELSYDERERAEFMSYTFQTEHYEMVLKAGDMERALPGVVHHLEEPRVGQSYPNFYVARLAGKFVKVVLSGVGGDEIFGGYPWRYYRAVVNENFENYVDKYYLYWQRLVNNRDLRRLFRPIWSDVSSVWTRDIFGSVFANHLPELTRPEDYINHSLYFESRTFLHGLLVVEDKLSMAHGLETRIPFLDNDLVDFAMRLPVRMKLNRLDEVIRRNENNPGPKSEGYFEKTNDGKLLLRRLMSRYIPDSITQLAKQGFSAPDASWFRGESIDYVRRLLYSPDTRLYEVMDADTVRGLVDEHLEGKINRRLLVWSLIYFENWLRAFVKG
jgi:asparagine synthase (glutamine-hydrolysing)